MSTSIDIREAKAKGAFTEAGNALFSASAPRVRRDEQCPSDGATLLQSAQSRQSS